jgi:hypothetical protein
MSSFPTLFWEIPMNRLLSIIGLVCFALSIGGCGSPSSPEGALRNHIYDVFRRNEKKDVVYEAKDWQTVMWALHISDRLRGRYTRVLYHGKVAEEQREVFNSKECETYFQELMNKDGKRWYRMHLTFFPGPSPTSVRSWSPELVGNSLVGLRVMVVVQCWCTDLWPTEEEADKAWNGSGGANLCDYTLVFDYQNKKWNLNIEKTIKETGGICTGALDGIVRLFQVND